MGCATCGGYFPPSTPAKGIDGVWAVRYPQGALRPFPSEADARAFAARKGGAYRVVPPEPSDG